MFIKPDICVRTVCLVVLMNIQIWDGMLHMPSCTVSTVQDEFWTAQPKATAHTEVDSSFHHSTYPVNAEGNRIHSLTHLSYYKDQRRTTTKYY